MSLLSRLAVQAARAYGILSSNPNNVSADYLVVAGGGGGAGNYTGGGGGAGGYQTSTTTLSTLNTYSIAVGAGGSGTNTAGGTGTSGSNSVLSGTGLTTITSTGGGGGGGSNVSGSATNGAAGGSGGGGGSYGGVNGTGGAGTSGQGNNGGSGNGINGVRSVAGGGGGASAVGGTSSSTAGGNGGAGSSSSISGSSVTYAGGGGGGSDAGAGGSGGSGGGGAGGGSAAGTAATVNTGGGGGGGGAYNTGAAGGSGIVIISYTSATPKFVGGTITTSGGKQIHTFTSSGTLSPITPITASYLVVAGGGGAGGQETAFGGGGWSGGGGGAGGLLTSSTTLYSGATYVVTVGAGGAGGASQSGTGSDGSAGSNSVLSGTGITTITSTGGGFGGGGGGTGAGRAGGNGGSGGGAGWGNGGNNAGGTGVSGQGFAGGTSTSAGAGGGGGAGSAGGGGATAGARGTGVASSISGSSITYATGGRGLSTSTNTSGTPNSGNGGDNPTSINQNSLAGGSGVVIISYAGSQVFNGGLVTSSGGNTIHTFTSTGALTPLTNNLNNSLRFRGSNSAYLNRTPTVAGNRKTWTWSAWIKLGTISVNMGTLFIAQGQTAIYLNDGTYSSFRVNGAAGSDLITSMMPRDPSAWYHLVVACDTTQAVEANRLKIYVNGVQQTAFQAGSAYPTLNGDTYVNSTAAHYIGRRVWNSDQQYDGYMTDINFIDGQALEPYYFGNNDANGVWKPILYKGTYGTNGFYLTFGNTTSTTTLGYDSSPNGNNWTCNNISLTSGTTYDAMTDVPTNTSATVANYPTLNPLSNTSTLTEANLSASNILLAGTTMATPTTGKWYFEYTQTTSIPSGSLWVGVASNTNAVADNQLQGYAYASDGRKVAYNSYTSGYGSTWTNGDVIGCALDLDNQTITFYKNNVSQGTAFTSITAQPYVFALSAGGAASTKGGSINCGQRPFSYTPPTGYVALNTYNLPTPTILQGNRYMDATLYTGAGANLNIVNAAQFQPDLVWIKNRSNAQSHILFDSVRGVNLELSTNVTNAEATYSGVSSFNSNGFSLGTADGNTNGYTYVGWQWQAGQGTTSSNTSGSITSTVSVNTTAGFSVVTYTSQASGSATFGHGLGVAPSMIFLKGRNVAGGWYVYHSALGGTKYLALQSTGAATTAADGWNNTNPTSTLVTVGNGYAGSYNMVAYCWAEIAGFSKFGSYTGNGSTDGPFVYTGFRPKFLLIKRTDLGGSWYIWDTARSSASMGNVVGYQLYPDLSNAESGSGTDYDLLSNGFKTRGNYTDINGSGATYIYAAFAEHPFKNSNAR